MSLTPGLPAPYVLALEEVTEEVLSLSPGGVPLGTVGPGNPVTLSLARPTATTTAILADIAAITLLCRLVGAHVVSCGRGEEWRELAAAASTERNPVEWLPPEAVTTLTGSFERPLVAVVTADSWETVAPAATRSWTSFVVVLPRVDLASMTIARAADIVILGAVPRPHLTLVRSTLRLPGEAVSELPRQPWSQVLVVARARYAPVDLQPSGEERVHCGPPGERSAPEQPTPPFWGERTFEEVAGLRAVLAVKGPPAASEQGEKP